ncbi:MAG TPA: hypothetical protein VFR27_10265 [Mycobacterium sp.]|nr:hypothetical protein [Mycobacterium sp.]
MWCPSATLSVWANSWLARRAAPDDVLDALSLWAPTQSVTAHDAVAAGNTGLPWPDAHSTGTMSLLQTLRTAAGAQPAATIRPVLPVAGDVRGLPAGTWFAHEALAAGEAIIAAAPGGCAPVGLVPEFAADDPEASEADALRWTVYALPDAPVVDQHDLANAEYALRSAVRSAVDALNSVGAAGAGPDVDDPRLLVEQLVESARRHRVPDHAPSRAVRVLESAAQVDAIVTVSSEMAGVAAQSASASQRVTDAVRPLAAVVRSARTAAVDAILRSAWQG